MRKPQKAQATADKLFEPIIEDLSKTPGVTISKMFGSVGLKFNNKVFAMVVKGRLVVKLPQNRVEALITSKTGEHFDPGHGRIMKGWVAIAPSNKDTWLKLTKAAKDFVVANLT